MITADYNLNQLPVPNFTILVPSYNQAHFLPTALNSLLAQTHSNWEAVVINDGSTDTTAQVAEAFAVRDHRIRVFHQQNGGVANALNAGLSKARGEWICWLSSDDLFEPYKLTVHMDAIRCNPECLFFHSGYSCLDETTSVKAQVPVYDSTDRDLQVLNFFRSCWVHGNSFAAHRSIFGQIGGFVQGSYHNAQDFEMWLRISTHYELCYIPYNTCITRIHPEQPTTQFFEAGKLDCVHACYDFLNNHQFQDLFPFLDLNQIDSARKALVETIRIYLEPDAYFHAAGYNPALLDRLYEWLENESPQAFRIELRSFFEGLIRQLLSNELPKDVRSLFQSYLLREKRSFAYTSNNFITKVVELSRGTDNTARLMKRYLAEHLLLEASRDKIRSNDVDAARDLLENAYLILPFSALIKGKLLDVVNKTTSDAMSNCGQKKSLRVLLINPPYRRFLNLSNNTFPLTFGNMATMVAQAGHNVAIYDADFDKNLLCNSYNYQEMFVRQHLISEGLNSIFHPVWEEVDRTIRLFKPDVVGITAMTPKYPMVEKIAEITKLIDPETKIVIGGHHPSIVGEQVFQNGNIDIVVVGEGELTFLELIQALALNNQDLGGINGILFKNERGEIIRTAPRQPIEDLDMLPIADRDLILNKDYVSDNNIISSRGCPFSCTYCGADVIWKHKQRRRSVDNIMEEASYLIKRSGSKVIAFWDDSFTVNMQHTLELLDALKSIPGITFSCITRLDLINHEIVRALKQAGCATIYFGIESGNDRILALMNKHLTKDLIREKIKLVNESGISWLGFFMLGYPGETCEDILETLDFMRELDPPYAEINIFNPLPGTKAWIDLERSGKIGAWTDLTRHSQSSTDNHYLAMDTDAFRELALFVAGEFDKHNAKK